MDSFYEFDEAKVEAVRKSKLWMQDAKYFKRVKVSPSATIKMMTHCQSGVEKGTKKSGKPIEVMGLLLGRPDTEDPHCLVISDAQALPIEGFETRVVADDVDVINYMIELGDSLEVSRKERFCGWYHSHPFDLDVLSNCFLSNTDISTQLQWQRSEDPHGNPWLAIVIDPLYSIAKGRPEMMAFRVFPPEYTPPANETPDGTIVHDDRTRVAKWGACWNRYYKLEITFFMSELAKSTLGILNNKLLWHKALCSTDALNSENTQAVAENIALATEKVGTIASGRVGGGEGGSIVYSSDSGVVYPKTGKMAEAAGTIGSDKIREISSQLVKSALFGDVISPVSGASGAEGGDKMDI